MEFLTESEQVLFDIVQKLYATAYRNIDFCDTSITLTCGLSCSVRQEMSLSLKIEKNSQVQFMPGDKSGSFSSYLSLKPRLVQQCATEV